MNGGFNGLSTIVMFLLPLIGILAVFAARTMVSFGPSRPGIFLRHLTSPQRAYLRQQRGWIAG